MMTLVLICGWITATVLAVMAALFWRDPALGLRHTTHSVDLLPRVMADRYTAFALLAVGLTLYGDLWPLLILFAVCAFMGLVDGVIYARAGRAHWKHTISGILSLVAVGVTLAALLQTGAGEIGQAAGAATSVLD